MNNKIDAEKKEVAPSDAHASLDCNLNPASQGQDLRSVADKLAFRVTPHILRLIDHQDIHDPIGKQYIPSLLELQTTASESNDPIGDLLKEATPGLVHRYPDRALLKVVDACAVYCRFCLRREMVGQGLGVISGRDFQTALSYLTDHPEIWEVIISGGDPLVLSAERLRAILSELALIPHVEVLRIHSKLPIVDPERITAALVASLRVGKPVWLSVHCNHPRELTPEVKAALARLADAGIPLVSQTALLKGVNDDQKVLEQLFRGLVSARVKPYYLHHADLARGTSHFRTSIEEGQRLIRKLRGRLSGLCQPTYVLDIPGAFGKAPIEGSWISRLGEGGWEITDYCGENHYYRDDLSTTAEPLLGEELYPTSE